MGDRSHRRRRREGEGRHQEQVDTKDERDTVSKTASGSSGQWVVVPDSDSEDDIDALNKKRADDLRAKLRAGKTEQKTLSETPVEKEQEEGDINDHKDRKQNSVVLSAMDTQMMGPTASKSNPEDMTIAEMVAEERRLNHMGNSSALAAETIARDKGFSADNDYAEDNSSRLATMVKKKQLDLKNMAISQVQRMGKVLDECQLCAEDRSPDTDVIATGTRVYLTLGPSPELAPYSAVIVPIAHYKNTLGCETDEWEEIRNFQKCLAMMYMSMNMGVVFYENSARPWRLGHACIYCVPVPLHLVDDVAPFFQEAFLTSDTEWSQHRKVINTQGKGKLGFQASIAKEAPYVHVWLTIDGGLGHIVEDAGNWPEEDRFSREVIGGLLRVGPEVVKKKVTWGKDATRRAKFMLKWQKYDWTEQLN